MYVCVCVRVYACVRVWWLCVAVFAVCVNVFVVVAVVVCVCVYVCVSNCTYFINKSNNVRTRQTLDIHTRCPLN